MTEMGGGEKSGVVAWTFYIDGFFFSSFLTCITPVNPSYGFARSCYPVRFEQE
jgi:hypothetical protein